MLAPDALHGGGTRADVRRESADGPRAVRRVAQGVHHTGHVRRVASGAATATRAVTQQGLWATSREAPFPSAYGLARDPEHARRTHLAVPLEQQEHDLAAKHEAMRHGRRA